MRTEHFTFYHGTSAVSAERIIVEGIKVEYLTSLGAVSYAKNFASLILAHLRLDGHSTWEIDKALCDSAVISSIDAGSYDLWLKSLPYILGAKSKAYFDYGSFFVTGSRAVAYRYAVGNRYRSEFIRSLAGGIEVAKGINPSETKRILAQLEREEKELFAAIQSPSYPVVLEINGLNIEEFEAENVDENIDCSLILMSGLLDGNVDPQISFRLKKIHAENIIAIHDLKEWDINTAPCDDTVQAVRCSRDQWIAGYANGQR